MSTTLPNNGGSAFPVPPERLNNFNGDPHWSFPNPGMTLRDYFAAAALQRLSAHPTVTVYLPWQAIAEQAYVAADAMLAERAKTTKNKP